MLAYLLLLSPSAVLALLAVRRSKVFFVAVALIYWLAIGFRYKVGMDWDNYVITYVQSRDIAPSEFLLHSELGFQLLTWFAELTGGGILLVNAVSGLVFCLGLFAVARGCREPFIGIVVATPLLVVAFAMTATRQALALGLIFYLFATWDRRSTIGRMAFVIFASLFHFSAIFVMIFVALSAQTTVVVRTAAAIFIGVLIALITRLRPEAMEAYTRLYVGPGQKLQAPGALAHIGMLATAAMAYLLYRKRWVEVNGDNRLYHYLALGSLAAVPAALISSVAAYRFALYFWPAGMYVWSGFPALIQSGRARMFYRLVIVAVSAAILIGWLKLANSSVAWQPYRNWLVEGHGGSLRRSHVAR